jgi:catechol 2,3-dioxygenase-like lactoylglutathione lyase family enzyme
VKALFISFHAKDLAASRYFYEELLGLVPARVYDGAPHRFVNYDLGGLLFKVFEWTDTWYRSGHSGLMIETEDLDTVVARLETAGVKTFGIQVHEWGGRCCSVKDPSGSIFDLVDANQRGDI